MSTAERIKENIKKINGIQLTGDPNCSDVILLVEHIDYKPKNYFLSLMRNDVVRNNLSKILTINTEDAPKGLLNGFYCSLPKPLFDSTRHVAIPYPVLPDLGKFTGEFSGFDYMASFRGTNTASVRNHLFKSCMDKSIKLTEMPMSKFFKHTEKDKQNYITEIINSKFSICPRGFATSSYRLYEVMKFSRIPVILSDEWVAPKGPNWGKFSLHIKEDQVTKIPELLTNFNGNILEMHSNARNAWELHCTSEAIIKKIIKNIPQLIPLNKNQILKLKRNYYHCRLKQKSSDIRLNLSKLKSYSINFIRSHFN